VHDVDDVAGVAGDAGGVGDDADLFAVEQGVAVLGESFEAGAQSPAALGGGCGGCG
jgi:hypothetical protein